MEGQFPIEEQELKGQGQGYATLSFKSDGEQG